MDELRAIAFLTARQRYQDANLERRLKLQEAWEANESVLAAQDNLRAAAAAVRKAEDAVDATQRALEIVVDSPSAYDADVAEQLINWDHGEPTRGTQPT